MQWYVPVILNRVILNRVPTSYLYPSWSMRHFDCDQQFLKNVRSTLNFHKHIYFMVVPTGCEAKEAGPYRTFSKVSIKNIY